MSEDTSNLFTLRTAAAPAPDLRRVGTHPDYWYPLAWSDELKAGKTLGRRFAGEPIVLYRGSSGQVFALEDRCAHRQVPLHLGVVSGEELKCHYHGWTYNGTGKCVGVPYLGPDRAAERRQELSRARDRRADLRIPGRCGARREPPARHARLLAATRLQDPAAQPRGRLSLHVHAREPVRHEPSVHAPQADGFDPGTLPRPRSRRELGAGRVQLQSHRGQALRWASRSSSTSCARAARPRRTSRITCASAPTTRTRT